MLPDVRKEVEREVRSAVDPVVDGLVQSSTMRSCVSAKVVVANRRVGKGRGLCVVQALSLSGCGVLGRL